MGVLTVETGASTKARPWVRYAEYGTLAIFTILTGVTAYLHEPWSDEANSWLLGRDVSLAVLWTHLMHYEGTPGLWQTLLHVLMRVGLPYAGMNFFSGALGCAAAWTIIRKSAMPLAIRLAMPFTFYIFYQYSIVARSYCLLPVLLSLCAWMYPRGREKAGVVTLLLCLMAGVSVHGMILSAAIWISFHWDMARRWREVDSATRKKIYVLAGVYFLAALLLAWSAWPAPDVTFAKERDYSVDHLLDTSGETLANAFTGEWISSLVLVAACVPFLWRGGGLLMFATAFCGLFLFNAYVYANMWHEGIPFLAWLFAMWISWRAVDVKWIRILGIAGSLTVIGAQGYWAFETAAYDWGNPYSGAREAARYIKQHGVVKAGVEGFGFACVALQPYFDRNIFPNFRDGEASGYFDWSEALRNFDGLDELAESRPAYAILGYKDQESRILDGRTIRKSGYKLIQHFDGNLFWHDDVLEPDGIDLYQRIDKPQ